MDQLEGNRDLPDLLRDAIRPSRAIAFEQLPKADAIKEHSDLDEAFKTLRTAAQYFEMRLPGDTPAQRNALLAVAKHVQAMLDDGETRGFYSSSHDQQRDQDPRLPQ
jgi:cell filamentation protein